MKLPGLRKVLLISLLATTLILVGASLWLLNAESALQLIARHASTATGGSLQLTAPTGRLLGPIDIDEVRWEDADWSFQAKKVRLEWSPGALLDQKLLIDQIELASVTVRKKTVSTAGTPPASLRLPFGILIRNFQVGQLQYADFPAVRDLILSLESDGQQLRIELPGARLAEVSISGKSVIDGRGPVNIEATGTLTGKALERPLRLEFAVTGPIERLAVRAVAQQGITGDANLIATPFASVPVSSAQVRLRDIDPSAWHPSAPRATIALTADISPDATGLSGRFQASNTTAGPLDTNQLPIRRASGDMRWQDDRAQFGTVTIDLTGQGKLDGSGQWKDQAFDFDLMASQLDPELLHSKLRTASLSGVIKGRAGQSKQTMVVDLKDPRFSILGEVTHQNNELSIPGVRLNSGKATLAASGHLALNERSDYDVKGELRGFDPGRFAKLPSATINADLAARGHLFPHLKIDGGFTVSDSRAFGQPMSGSGRIDLDGPLLESSQLQFDIGPNRINAAGSFGGAGKTLSIEIAAPQLDFPDLIGDLSGTISLSGTRKNPLIKANLTSSQLTLPGKGTLRGASLNANGGSAPDNLLHIALGAETLGLATRSEPLRAIRLTVDGSNRDHRVDGSVAITANRNLTLTAQGGLIDDASITGWQGKITGARLANDTDRTLVRLEAPAPIEVFAHRWKAGPIKLSDEPRVWLAELGAEANHTEIKANLEAKGNRIGTISGRLTAGMDTAWSLSDIRPWQGRVIATIPDLSWVSGVVGEGWKSEGRLNGEISLAGTPGKPSINGKVQGADLALRLREQGLNLVRGTLDAEITNNRLTLKMLSLESESKPVPQALRLAHPDTPSLIRTPGKVSVSGELTLGQSLERETGKITFELDRVGIYQQPDQWILVSGDGKLDWNEGALGIQGAATADAGFWRLTASAAPRLGDDVVIRQPGKKVDTANDRTRIDLDFSTKLGKRFLFSGGGLDTRLEGDVRWRKSGRDVTRATGSIHAVGGRFEAYGQQLDIERGILSFNGLPDNPAVDVRAWRRGLPVEAGVDVTGTAKKPIVKLISQPELSEAEKFSWLVLGHGPEQMSASDAAILVSAAGSALGVGAGGGSQLKKTLGVDEFGLRQGTVSENMSRMPTSRVAGNSTSGVASSESQTVSVAKRISADTVIAYEQTLGTAETILKLTHNLTRRLAVIGRVGTDNAIDVFYSLTTDSR